MAKLDDLMRASRDVAAESMGAGRQPATMHRASTPPATPATPTRLQGIARSKDAATIPLDRIAPDPDQPREEFEEDALARLAESLKARGQLQPIRVRWDEASGIYRIIMGERRWRAARMAGLATLSCVITEGAIDPGDLLAIQLVENCLREDLQPIEQAKAFRTLMERHRWSQRRLADELGIVQSNVVRALALLDLPASVQEKVEQGALPPATAYEVSKLADPAIQSEVAARVVAENLSRAETVEVIRQAAERTPRAKMAGKGRAAVKARPKPTRTLKAAGCKVTVENRRGVDDDLLIAALREALGQVVPPAFGAGDEAGGMRIPSEHVAA